MAREGQGYPCKRHDMMMIIAEHFLLEDHMKYVFVPSFLWECNQNCVASKFNIFFFLVLFTIKYSFAKFEESSNVKFTKSNCWIIVNAWKYFFSLLVVLMRLNFLFVMMLRPRNQSWNQIHYALKILLTALLYSVCTI